VTDVKAWLEVVAVKDAWGANRIVIAKVEAAVAVARRSCFDDLSSMEG